MKNNHRTVLRLVGLVCLVILGLTGYAMAQTPDGETPANEGVCDPLIGGTPALYGLCVGFCEAQDCEVTVDGATGEVTFDPGCKPSSPRLLANYDKRRQPSDPPMPCVNVAEAGCPCWTEVELDGIADGSLIFCGSFGNFDALLGIDAATNAFESALAGLLPNSAGSLACSYGSLTPSLFRFFTLSVEEFLVCRDSIAAECIERGL